MRLPWKKNKPLPPDYWLTVLSALSIGGWFGKTNAETDRSVSHYMTLGVIAFCAIMLAIQSWKVFTRTYWNGNTWNKSNENNSSNQPEPHSPKQSTDSGTSTPTT